MKRTFRKALLLFFLSSFVVSIYQLVQHWNYEETLLDISKELRVKVKAADISREIQSSIDQNQFDDARMYIDIAKANDYKIDYLSFQQQLSKKDTRLKRVLNNASNFINGFASGESGSLAGIAGAVSADFTVVGDVRDLAQQYKKHQQGKDVNELIVVLSGAGIGLTAITVGSFGSSIPAKTGTSMIKLAVKTQRLTRGFQKQLIKQGRKVFDWPVFTRLAKQDKSLNNIRRAARQAYHPKAVKPLKQMAVQVNGIRKASSTADTMHLLKYVENADDLRYLEKITLKHGAKTKGLLKLVGKGALRTVRVLRKTTALLLSVFTSIFSAVLSLVLILMGKRKQSFDSKA